ncbi:MAG: hypothetical protein AABO57_21460 [Acidobacteriota bacterium]
MTGFNTRCSIETSLGVDLPEGAANLHYYKLEPGSEIAYYTKYLKFSTSLSEFLELMGRMQMTLFGRGGAAYMYLPGAWEAEPGVQLGWWDPTPETPDNSAARGLGANGWIIAKYERGCAYIIATDTGRYDGTGHQRDSEADQ